MSFSEEDLLEFEAEALELLEIAEKSLLSLDQGGEFRPAFDSIFRCFHNLKGASGMMELLALQTLTHELENILMEFKDAHSIPHEYISLFLEGVDSARSVLKRVETAAPFGKISNSSKFIVEPVSKLIVEKAKNLKAVYRGALLKCLIYIRAEVQSLKSESSVTSVEVQLPVLIKKLNDAFLKLAAEKLQQVPSTLSPSIKQVSTTESESNGSIRVSVLLLDKLMILIDEMAVVRNEVIKYSSRSEDGEILKLTKKLNFVTSEIQDEIMKMRMQPIGSILNKFNRVVRDLSRQLKKEINLNLFGGETELDKSLLESIKDPLAHIIRNSCDHGIESPSERVSSGKPRLGTINVRSYYEDGHVVIHIADDGKGLRKEVLVNTGIEKGIITPTHAANMTEKEIFNLIFAPGFSTAPSVTNLSGRGVGMDVVRTNVEKVGGTVELHSISGKGTTTMIKIPVSLMNVPTKKAKAA